jgi:peptidoglycan/LPS O-acetylase OafA/YrhL
VIEVHQVGSHTISYRPEIDGLRAFAVISVVVFHAFPNLIKGGFIGVDIFFVISGFLITGHIFEKLDEDRFEFLDFYARRIRRIFPALILVMISSLAFGWFALLADEYAKLGEHVAGGAAFILNFMLVYEAGYFDTAAETKPMLHLWSLAVEEQFYIFWPAFLWIAWRFKFNLLTITILVAIMSFYLNIRFVQSKPIQTFFWPVGRLWELLSGSAVAWLLLYESEALSRIRLGIDRILLKIIYSKKITADGSTFSNLTSIFGILFLIFGVFGINEDLAFPSQWTLIPVLGAILIIMAGSKALFSRLFLMNKLAIWFGLISYPLYLWHWPILSYLKIIEGDSQNINLRGAVLVLSISLAWLTYKYIEAPIRFGMLKRRISAFLIGFSLFLVGVSGYYISTIDVSKTHRYEDMIFQRKVFENGIGNSMKWYEGKEDWLFLGNEYDNTVAELRLAITPSEEGIAEVFSRFAYIASVASESNTQVALLMGPNKSSIYPEFLPDKFVPSRMRYSTSYMEKLATIPNFIAYDPTDDLRQAKLSNGIIYFRTDTHWNSKGAYLAYMGLLKELRLNSPVVAFSAGDPRKGDLIDIAGLTNFPLHSDDNWIFKMADMGNLTVEELQDEPLDSFGPKVLVKNSMPLNNMTVWVVGDSFITPLRPYLNATFKEVRYIGHWSQKLNSLASVLRMADEKPDLVLIEKVERSF